MLGTGNTGAADKTNVDIMHLTQMSAPLCSEATNAPAPSQPAMRLDLLARLLTRTANP